MILNLIKLCQVKDFTMLTILLMSWRLRTWWKIIQSFYHKLWAFWCHKIANPWNKLWFCQIPLKSHFTKWQFNVIHPFRSYWTCKALCWLSYKNNYNFQPTHHQICRLMHAYLCIKTYNYKALSNNVSLLYPNDNKLNYTFHCTSFDRCLVSN